MSEPVIISEQGEIYTVEIDDYWRGNLLDLQLDLEFGITNDTINLEE